MRRSSVRIGAVLGLPLALCGCEPERRPDLVPSASNSAVAGATSSSFTPKLEVPSVGPGPRLHGIGERAVARDYSMTVLSVDDCVVEPHFQPARGRIKLGVQVELEGGSERQVPANPFVATLADSEQRSHAADLAGCTPTLHARQLSKGQKVTGYISFEIPGSTRGLVMTYAPFVVGAGPEELRFSLGR